MLAAIARLLTVLAPAILLIAAPASAQVLSVETWVEEWDAASGQWVRVADGADRLQAARLAPSAKAEQAIASYGPFRVLDERRAALDGVTNGNSPAYFQAMLRDHPGIEVLEMHDCPGTDDDRGNLALGRLIRAAGLETHVPAGGSVRSGAVEVFLAGATRRIDEGAEFAVHSWLDSYGYEAADYAANSAANRLYIDYYREMGMSETRAQAFYDMTNSVPHASARWLTAGEMRQWIAPARVALAQAPKIAYQATGYLDSQPVLP
ncbi:alpha/beta hydrolase [Erythrobacter sp. HKB08]|uniref:alpha/beta hydrolase n=1 Tax=Erythrobacter sp. HKB08 TaxID=2502843 RepID=UPI0018F86738|nr:alpha/beta hydrolase [Erythrobacter sp. HKB08]